MHRIITNDGVKRFHVEVKTSHEGAKTGVMALQSVQKRGSQDHRDADFVVLLAARQNGLWRSVRGADVERYTRQEFCHHLASWDLVPTFTGATLLQYRQSMRKLRIPAGEPCRLDTLLTNISFSRYNVRTNQECDYTIWFDVVGFDAQQIHQFVKRWMETALSRHFLHG
jgi:hypothetical protein